MTLTILCYLSNDFDLINHGKVIMNLEFYGIQGPSDVEIHLRNIILNVGSNMVQF